MRTGFESDIFSIFVLITMFYLFLCKYLILLFRNLYNNTSIQYYVYTFLNCIYCPHVSSQDTNRQA